ncbi:MAG: hypothetical protein CMP23_12555 [Rickettsiales bacterium]|nr:hypothetical protein [Rickettsiales bacterium]
MTAEGIKSTLRGLVIPNSLLDGTDRERRGFDVEGEISPDAIVAIAKLFFGAGYGLECITAVDQEDFRELWYQFNILTGAPQRHLLRMQLDQSDQVPSISHIYGSARWFEREAFDMMGVQVLGHPNLKRLLLPEDSDFYPLRRDQCIDEELRKTRENRRTKRLAAAEKERAKADAETAALGAAEGSRAEATTTKAPAPVEQVTEASAPTGDPQADAPTQDAVPVVDKGGHR